MEVFVLLKMSGEENKIVKPKTDSELFLNNANQCDWKNLKNDSCAGANAASRADMTLATTDPLSELVWSSDKGLSLKCADSSFADKNSSLFRDVGPSCYNQCKKHIGCYFKYSFQHLKYTLNVQKSRFIELNVFIREI